MRSESWNDKIYKRVMYLQTCSGGEAGVYMPTHVKIGLYVDVNMVVLLPKRSIGAADYLNEKVNILPSMIKRGTGYALLSTQKEQVNLCSVEESYYVNYFL